MIRRRPIPRCPEKEKRSVILKELMEGVLALLILIAVILVLISLGGSQYGG